MNETFDFRRFGHYFAYDLRRMVRNNGKALAIICGIGLIFYVVAVSFHLVTGQEWAGPGIAARASMLVVAVMILQLYYTRTYGYLTEKQAGSRYLMLPVSVTEKFVSMLLVDLIVLPVVFFVTYLGLDALITLLDPTVGPALLKGGDGLRTEVADLFTGDPDPYRPAFGGGAIVYGTVAGFVANILFFQLCGLLFRRWKIVGAIAILFGFFFLLMVGMGILAQSDAFRAFTDSLVDEDAVMRFVTSLFRGLNGLATVVAIGFGAAIFFRIKALKH